MFGQDMADKEKERGRLFSIQVDGSDSVPFIIKKDTLLIGRGDSCEIRIYVDGVAHEHCILTFNEDGRGFVESLNKCGHTFLNGELIERQVSLEHNDIITVVKRNFRFYYPTSSKYFVTNEPASFEDNMVKVLTDPEVEEAFSKKGKDIPEKHVTFGPRLSPEEFDKRMPPASPLRKGSLPGDKDKTPSQECNAAKAMFKKNLFTNSPARALKIFEKSAAEMPKSSVVLKRLSCSSENMKGSMKANPSRPLFSEIVKKSVENPPKSTDQNVAQKCSPQKFVKKTKIKDTRKVFYQSPRRPVNPRLLEVGSTGHANSPETIVLRRKQCSPISSVKRRKSIRLLQEKIVTETISERSTSKRSADVNENSSVMSSKSKSFIQTPIVEVCESLAMKQKVNDENKDDTSYEESTSSRRTVGRPTRKSASNSARKSLSTPIRESLSSPTMRNEDKISDELNEHESEGELIELEHESEFIEDELQSEFVEENEFLSEDEFIERELNAREMSKSETPSTSSSLVSAINNVAQIDGNNLNKSLKDIHNIVQELSCHSNVPTLDSERLTADMCTNAVKKLALTISMINAFHMYNRIIDDVSTFPLPLPSTSFESNRDSMRQLPRSVGRQNKDFSGMSWFQNIMHNSFSNSASNEPRHMLRAQENVLSPATESSLLNKKSRRSKLISGNRMHLRAIDSDQSTLIQQFNDFRAALEMHKENGDDDEGNESNHSDNECDSVLISSNHSKSPRTSMTNKERISAPSTSKISLPFDKGNSPNSPSLHTLADDDGSISSNLDLQKTRGERMSSDSARRQSTSKLVQSISGTPRESFEKKKPIFSKGPNITISPQKIVKRANDVASAYSKMLRSQSSTLLKLKPRKASLLAKNSVMTASKKLKAQRKEQKHRLDILKKIKYRVESPKVEKFKSILKSPKAIKVSLKESIRRSNLLKPKVVRLSQKILKKAKSKKRLSSALRLSGRLVTSKDSKRNLEKKSVLKTSGTKSKKSSKSARLSFEKKKSLSPKVENKRAGRSRSVKVKSGQNNDSIDIKRQSLSNESKKIPVKSVTKSVRKRKAAEGNLNSTIDIRSDVQSKENDVAVDKRSQSSKDESESGSVNAKPKNQRNKKVTFGNVAIVDSSSDDFNKENDIPAVKQVARKLRKRQMKSDDSLDLAESKNISESERTEKRPKAAVQSKKRGRPKRNISQIRSNSPSVSFNENESKSSSNEVADISQTDKKVRISKRNQKIEVDVSSTAEKRTTRRTNKKDTKVAQIKRTLNEENVEVKIKKKARKQKKAAEPKKNDLDTSPPAKRIRSTRRKNIEVVTIVDEPEISAVAEVTKKVDQKKGRKRKVECNASETSAKIPLLAEDKKNMPASTPKRGRSKVQKGEKFKKVSPAVQRSLRSRK